MNARICRTLILIPGLLLLTFTTAAAQQPDILVGPEGTVVQLRSGPYGELFPEGSETHPENLVLALDVQRSDSSERLLVPRTESFTPETSATLLYEKSADVVYLLWEGLYNSIHPILYLTNFDGAQWAEVIEIAGGVFASKGHPQLVVSRDSSVPMKTEGAPAAFTDRAVMHVVWWEEGAVGSYKRFAPLVFQDGIFLGWNPLRNLASFSLKSGDGIAVDPNIENALRIQPGSKSNAAVIGFLNHETGRLITLEVETLPRELSRLAEEVSVLILEIGPECTSPEDLGERIRSAVLELGVDFHPGSLSYIADQVRAMIAEEHGELSAEGIVDFSEKMGAHIIHMGVRMKSNGLDSAEATEIIEIGQSGSGGGPYHHLKVSLLSDREPPEVGGAATLYLSRSGQDVLVVWDEDGSVCYRESEGDEWSDLQSIELSEDLDRDTVYQILAERILNR